MRRRCLACGEPVSWFQQGSRFCSLDCFHWYDNLPRLRRLLVRASRALERVV